jgi:transposase
MWCARLNLKKKNVMTDDFQKHRLLAAKFAAGTSVAEAARTFDLTEGVVKYWSRKRKDPNFHPSLRGGVRYKKFSEEQQREYETCLLQEIQSSSNSVTVYLEFCALFS